EQARRAEQEVHREAEEHQEHGGEAAHHGERAAAVDRADRGEEVPGEPRGDQEPEQGPRDEEHGRAGGEVGGGRGRHPARRPRARERAGRRRARGPGRPQPVHRERGRGHHGRAAQHRRGHARRDDLERAQMCITRPRESSAASATASESVGCAWIARSTSSTVYSLVRATTSSWISSDACAPTMWAPRISPYLASRTIFTSPSVSPAVRARPLALKGNRPTWISWPLARA